MTPGELRRGGESLHIQTGVHDTRFGPLFLATTPRGLCGALFVDDGGSRRAQQQRGHAWLHERFPRAQIEPGINECQLSALACMEGVTGTRHKPLALHLRGSPFQLKVWECLLRVPAGQLATYSQIAAGVAREGAARAVGTAIGANPVALLVPCHRVIRASGALGGYRWGLPRKAALIAWESAQAERPGRYNGPIATD
jgi:AraC family transcriptional regulator of adaptative response/methylated-DNA-[protein]-cysteine methyltransferase